MSEEKIIAEIITLIRYKNKDYEVRDIINYLYNELSKKENIIEEAIEYIENGCDFKSIYFKETDSDLWKIFMKDDIKNDLLKILKGESK